MNKIKQKLKSGEVSLGAWNMIDNSTVAEILASAGVDWVAIDMEHGTGVTQLIPRITAIEAAGCTPLCRLPINNELYYKQALDAGAAGVIVPMVNTPGEARRAVHRTRYPPDGIRGVGVCRAQGHGANFQEYIERANEDILLAIQVEHILAVDNIAIICTEKIDAVFIGPYDLSGSMGLLGQTRHPDVERGITKVVDTVNKVPWIALGIHIVEPQPGEVEQRIAEGYQFIALGLDTLSLRQGIQRMLKCYDY